MFVTTKVWNSDQGYPSTLSAFDESRKRLRIDYVDLYLIHWPAPALDRYLDTWRAMETLLADGSVRAIGVSNFTVTQLERLLATADVVPAVNQIELHPALIQQELREFHARHDLVTEAWTPLARGARLDDPVLVEFAVEHGVSPAQVVLAWHLALDNVVISKPVTPQRIRANIDVFDVALTPDEIASISRLDNGRRTGFDAETFNRAAHHPIRARPVGQQDRRQPAAPSLSARCVGGTGDRQSRGVNAGVSCMWLRMGVRSGSIRRGGVHQGTPSRMVTVHPLGPNSRW